MNDRSDLIEEKKRFRQEATARREATSARYRARAARAFAETGLGFLPARPGSVVSGYHPFGAEADCLPLLQDLAGKGHVTALPVVVAPRQPLAFRRWAPGAPLMTGRWDIQVPPESAGEVRPDILLVPLLAFDAQGHRMGYGGGFYDRTLHTLRALKSVTAVGLAFSMQAVDKVPHAAYDARLDWVLTEDGPIRTGGA